MIRVIPPTVYESADALVELALNQEFDTIVGRYQTAEKVVEKVLFDEALPLPEASPGQPIRREWIRIDYVLAFDLLTNLGVLVKNEVTGRQYVFGVNRHTLTAQLVSKH
ncbi:hypothetical protein [Rhizobium sp. CCGE 510]|uniref:hypothetical protein n=1 Tax=Rhizobium sp. CCGE 510 TaxID=1132836 RepID=UPI00027B7E72|nr:hypothetical protein [Rhizobium sp. CCGE 510]EJT04946.1 hypothetical protein RCCGE510_12461 [Rhizobium sp. CCGE 510]